MRQHRPVDEGLSMENAIEIRHLAYSYPDDTSTEHVVFQDLSLDIEQGSFVAVLGHNGCGKSTLAKHLNAILLPEGGTVTVYGLDTKQEENLLAIRQQVGMVFQNPDNQIVSNVVEEDVAFAPENLGVASEEIRRRVDAALEAVGMLAYKKHAPHLLSGGQKQRVAIAGVLAMQPKTIVLDEPTAMLDPQGRQEVVSIVEKLSREQNITVVLITHHMDEALEAVGMAAYKKHAPHLLSGGQKQRVAIAGVLAMQPKTIVLDEPTAMLDPQGRQEVVSIVEKLSREQNITVILITHHMDEAICADRVIAMDDGKIIADGAPKDVFTKIDLLQSVGLTAPQTTLLLKALDDDGCALPLDALSVDDCAQALLRQILQAKA